MTNLPPMLSSLDDLFLFGGPKAFKETLHVGRPNIGDRALFMRYADRIFDDRWLTNNGPLVSDFEQRISELTGARQCIAMCNGTIALEIAIRALGLSGEVIVPSLTFIATAHSLQWQEITPVFCDVDPETHTISPSKIESLITPKTTGIIGVHLWGRPCAIAEIEEIADRHNLKLVFDAAHALGCSYRDKMIGNFGDAEVFSFHATKFINTFEGGMVLTNNDELAAKIRLMKNFGFAGYDQVVHIGTNGKMNEMSAAMGLVSLACIDDFINTNHVNYTEYERELRGIPGLRIVTYPENGKANYQYIVLEVDENHTGISRDQLMQVLHSENIFARRYFYPGCHRMEPYKSYFPHSGLLLPETERLAERLLVLPTGTSINREAIQTICSLIKIVIEHNQEVVSKLQSISEK